MVGFRKWSLAAVVALSGCAGSVSDPGDETGDETGESTNDAAEETSEVTGEDTGSEDSDTADSTDDTSDSEDTGDTGDTSDTTEGGDFEGVACDAEVCLAPELCCSSMTGSTCAETCGEGETTNECDGPEDCESGTCCWGLLGGGVCADGPEACVDPTPEVACHEPADCPAEGATCEPHMWVAWISICGA